MGKGHIPTYHPPAPGSGSNPGGNPSSHDGGQQDGGTKGGAPNSYASMYAQQKRDEKEAQRKAANRYLDQAKTLQQQVLGLRKALGVHGFKHRLDIQLGNIDMRQKIADATIMHGYHGRIEGLVESERDNSRSANDQTYANLQNRSRERSNALSESTANGAGESDILRAQSMSLSNWNANQSEVNRSFYDTRTSINAGLRDLNEDTYTARINNATQSGADRETVWNSYYDRRSEALTQLGNTLGQQAEYYGLAYEQVQGKKTKQRQHAVSAASGHAFGQASIAAGGGYKDPGVSKQLKNWDGHQDFEGRLNNSKFSSASTELAPKKPEGAGLRSWTA